MRQGFAVKGATRFLNAMQLVVLCILSTGLMGAGLLGFGASLLTTAVWSVIGGVVVTLWLTMFCVGMIERRSQRPTVEEIVTPEDDVAPEVAWDRAGVLQTTLNRPEPAQSVGS